MSPRRNGGEGERRPATTHRADSRGRTSLQTSSEKGGAACSDRSPLSGRLRGAETSPWTSGRVGEAQPLPAQRRPQDGRGDHLLCRRVRANNLLGMSSRTRPTGGGKAEGAAADNTARRPWGDIDAADSSVKTAVGDSVVNQTTRGRRSGSWSRRKVFDYLCESAQGAAAADEAPTGRGRRRIVTLR